jgi:transcription antitermination factor NusG
MTDDTEQPLIMTASEPDARWFVAHTRPRCEKKLLEHCVRNEFAATLPCYSSAHKYRGKTVVFHKPLFPSYVFLHLPPRQSSNVRQSDLVANLLDVPDQELLEAQLVDILRAVKAGLEIQLAPEIGSGTRVRIKSGALRGVEGLVEERLGPDIVVLRLDFISQAAAVRIGADLLEVI